VVDLAGLPVLALAQVVAHRAQLPLLSRLPALAKVPLPVPVRVPAVGPLVVEREVLLHLLSRPSF
jgi:hypothetical protein